MSDLVKNSNCLMHRLIWIKHAFSWLACARGSCLNPRPPICVVPCALSSLLETPLEHDLYIQVWSILPSRHSVLSVSLCSSLPLQTLSHLPLQAAAFTCQYSLDDSKSICILRYSEEGVYGKSRKTPKHQEKWREPLVSWFAALYACVIVL